MVMRALNLMAQQHFEFAVLCNDEDVSEQNFKAQEEYDAIFALIREQVKCK